MAGSGMAALQWFLQVRKMAPVWKRRRAGFSEMQARQGTKSPLSLCSSLASLAMPGQRTPGSFPGSGVRAREDWSRWWWLGREGKQNSIPSALCLFRTGVLFEVSDLLWMLLDSGPVPAWVWMQSDAKTETER